MLKHFNFERSFKLWVHAWELFGSQLPVTAGGFGLQISCIQVLWILLSYLTLGPSGLGNYFLLQEIHSTNPPVVTGICDSNNSQVWNHHRSNICVGCFEISISVVVKHIQNIGIIRAFCLPGGTC